MATGGEENVGYSLAKVGTLTLEKTTNKYPWYISIVVCQDKIVVLDFYTYKVQIYRLHDGKFLASSDRPESRPRDMCLMDAMTICVLQRDGQIKMMVINTTDMSLDIKTTRTLRLEKVMNVYLCVVRLKDSLVVIGVRQGTMYWCVVSLDDGHVDTIHRICEGDGWSNVTTKDNMIYVSCNDGYKFPNNGVYGFDILNPSQCKYTYKHQRLQLPTSIVINEDGNIFVCNHGYPDFCIHQLTASCQLVAIFTQGIPWYLYAIFWDNGRLYATRWGSSDITVFRHEYQVGSRKDSEEQGNVDKGQSSVKTEMTPSGTNHDDSESGLAPEDSESGLAPEDSESGLAPEDSESGLAPEDSEDEKEGPVFYAEGKTRMEKGDGKEKGYRLEEELSNLSLEGYASKQKVKQQQIGGTLFGPSLATHAAGTGSGTSEMTTGWNYTVENLIEAWPSVEEYSLEELTPGIILPFFEKERLLSSEENETMLKLRRRQMAEKLLERIKAQLPEAFSSLVHALNETQQDLIVQGLRHQIERKHDPQPMSHDQETNAMVTSVVYYTFTLEMLKDGIILNDAESKTRAYLDKGRIIFDHCMRSQCLTWKAGSVIICLKPLGSLTKEGLRFFCVHNGIKNFVSDLLTRKIIFSSLPEGEMIVHVQVHCYNEDPTFEGADGPCRDYTPLNVQASFTVTDNPEMIKNNLSRQYDTFLEEIEPLHFKDTFVSREILDNLFFEGLKSLEQRRKRAARFLETIIEKGNKALAALVLALRNSGLDKLANDLCTVQECSSQFGDEGQVDYGSIEVVQMDWTTHTQEPMICASRMNATVRKNDGNKAQKRRLSDDQDESKQFLSKHQGTFGSASTSSVMEEQSINAKAKHNELCVKLDGLITRDSLRSIKRMARTYLDPKPLEKVENMDDLLSVLEEKGKIGVGHYDILKKIMSGANVRIGMDEIDKTARDIRDIMECSIPKQK